MALLNSRKGLQPRFLKFLYQSSRLAMLCFTYEKRLPIGLHSVAGRKRCCERLKSAGGQRGQDGQLADPLAASRIDRRSDGGSSHRNGRFASACRRLIAPVYENDFDVRNICEARYPVSGELVGHYVFRIVL